MCTGFAVGEDALRASQLLRCPRHGWLPVKSATHTFVDLANTPFPSPETLIGRLCALAIGPSKFCADVWALGALVLQLVCGVWDEAPPATIVSPPEEVVLQHVRSPPRPLKHVAAFVRVSLHLCVDVRVCV